MGTLTKRFKKAIAIGLTTLLMGGVGSAYGLTVTMACWGLLTAIVRTSSETPSTCNLTSTTALKLNNSAASKTGDTKTLNLNSDCTSLSVGISGFTYNSMIPIVPSCTKITGGELQHNINYNNTIKFAPVGPDVPILNSSCICTIT